VMASYDIPLGRPELDAARGQRERAIVGWRTESGAASG
jgi:hypothetical protein